jgi:TonB family protein
MRFAVVLCLAVAGLAAQDARETLNRGVAAFKAGRYADATAEFQKAVDADPSFLPAHLYLATAYMQQYVPGAESSENQSLWFRAESEFRKVLDLDRNNKVAMASIASLNLNAKKWDEARNWYKALINVDPADSVAYYSLGFIVWAQWYPEYSKARAAAGLAQAAPGPIPDASVRAALRAKWWPALDEGIWDLNQALSNKPQYADAMAYMNLLIRERADLRDTAEEYRRDVAEADQWVQKALEAKRAGASQPNGILEAPPPPPPPPPPPGVGSGTPSRIKVGGNVQQANLISQAPPVYPPDAKMARVQGIVRLSAIISKDGTIQHLEVVSGHPLLVPAAIDAAKQWVYRQTLLNGQPVEVQTMIDINFTLSQ